MFFMCRPIDKEELKRILELNNETLAQEIQKLIESPVFPVLYIIHPLQLKKLSKSKPQELPSILRMIVEDIYSEIADIERLGEFDESCFDDQPLWQNENSRDVQDAGTEACDEEKLARVRTLEKLKQMIDNPDCLSELSSSIAAYFSDHFWEFRFDQFESCIEDVVDDERAIDAAEYAEELLYKTDHDYHTFLASLKQYIENNFDQNSIESILDCLECEEVLESMGIENVSIRTYQDAGDKIRLSIEFGDDWQNPVIISVEIDSQLNCKIVDWHLDNHLVNRNLERVVNLKKILQE